MDTSTIVGVIAIVVVLATGWVLLRQPHPENAGEPADRSDEDGGPTGDPYPPGGRPAGPGAESQDPEGRPQP